MGKKSSARNNKSHVKQKPQVSPTPDKGTTVQRTHKDTLFRYIFRNKKKLLQLYNALNDSSYEDEDSLIITTLENIVYLGYKNDVSFLVDSLLCLFEHQGSWNPNMPIRGVMYYARLYSVFINTHSDNLYGSNLIPLPFPQYIVFYNGTDERPEQEILKLSDSFQIPEMFKNRKITPSLECTVTVLNINYGKNRELMEKCRPLMEYSLFIFYIRQNLVLGYPSEAAVDLAVERCLSENILSDILKAHRKEVTRMFLEDFNEEEYYRMLKREGFNDGFHSGFDSINALNRKLIADSRTDDLIRATSDPEYQKKLIKEYGLDLQQKQFLTEKS